MQNNTIVKQNFSASCPLPAFGGMQNNTIVKLLGRLLHEPKPLETCKTTLFRYSIKSNEVDFWKSSKKQCNEKEQIMTKTEIVKSIQKNAGLTREQANKALEAVLNSVAEGLVNGEAVQIVGFGTFSVTERAARTGRNPATGEAIEIPASKIAHFKSGKGLKEKLN